MATPRTARAAVTAALALLVAATPARADDGEVSAQLLGYLDARFFGVFGVDDELAQLETLGVVDFDEAGFHPDEVWGLQLRARPTLKLWIGEDVAVVGTVEASASFGFFGRVYDSVDDVLGVERLYTAITLGPLDLTLGKQLIRWGHGLLFNPTDLNNTREANDLNAELPGQWAVRTAFTITDEQSLTLAALIDEDVCCQPVVVGRYDATIDLTDIAGVAAWSGRTDEVLIGIDLKTELEIGAWAELTWTWEIENEDWHVDAEIGIDYSFDVLQSLYLALEWILQGDGAGGPWDTPGSKPLPDYLGATLDSFDTGRRRQLLGSSYLLFLSRLTIDTEWQVQLLHLLNIRDPSATLSLQATWWPHDSWEVIGGVQVNYGEPGGEYALELPDNGLIPPDLVGARLLPVALAFVWARFYY